MKILMVSMNSIHFTRWTSQLKDVGHEIYWFNILGTGYNPKLSWVQQIVDWKQRYPNLKGRYFIKNKLPFLYNFIKPLIEKSTIKTFEKAIQAIEPDIVHSFALYVSCAPILGVMKKYKSIKWVYSSWGSDLYYYQNIPNYLNDITSVLPHINYLFTDCQRDFELAKKYGFKGKFLGVFPGGGGYDFMIMDTFKKPLKERKTILIKGFQERSGRAITVLKAIELINEQLENYKLVVFGADKEVFDYVNQSSLKYWNNFQVLGKINQQQVWQLMGESLIYIGNSNSDGMPNTLLEAIAMGAFPIQSNPGGASADVITHNLNGFLIDNCNDITEIKNHVLKAVTDLNLLEEAFKINQNDIKPQFERTLIKSQVLEAYNSICN
ncbi:glycosyltransferase family 4 protein [Yeosuana sp.]|uniref:glycosyltransferase family 4 protein n=1 Tax=Yeosuana sp. TaxID=2529388 RepID=UPI004054BE4C|tara:strand:+ start:1081 stop:2220 length:1140 start_codon:yes stop_codon:yes gene_type:complete